MKDAEYRLASDIGGTFTDTVLVDGECNVLVTTKTPTTKESPAAGAIQGAEQVLLQAGVKWQQISGKIHGTTLATNALIERRGAIVATITTDGFRDILEIAYERRYSQYAINITKPDLIVPRELSFTIGGRMDYRGHELVPLNEDAVCDISRRLKQNKVDAIAICLLHAYANPAHELRLRELLNRENPQLSISLSHEVSPEAREFDRLCTTIANAYVQPLMASYLTDLRQRFRSNGLQCPILMMTAGGGMTTLETAARLPVRLVESGPAGGAILAARIAAEASEREVLSFDMGGTTAKLCLIDDHRPQTARKFEVSRAERFTKGSGMPVRIPVVEMIEIGAGGGSIASIDKLGRLQVGPESAGSTPGPVAFGKGGTQPTVTDADVSLGYIEPTQFAEGRLKIDRHAAEAALRQHIGEQPDSVASQAGFAVSDIVDENMASAGRMHAVESGKDISSRLMVAFGGNGPLHATRVARKARIQRILVPRDPGVGSAVGFLFAPVSYEIIRSRYTTLTNFDSDCINTLLAEMAQEADAVVRAGAPDQTPTHRCVAFMRYHGQGHEIEVPLPSRALKPEDSINLRAAFEREYSAQYNRTVPGMTVEILNWGLTASSTAPSLKPQATCYASTRILTASENSTIICDRDGTSCKAEIFHRDSLQSGDRIRGPALIIEPQTTTLVSKDFTADVDATGNLWLTQQTATDS